jgi:hypothetical protein
VVALGAVTVVTFSLYADLWARAFGYLDADLSVPRTLAVWSDIALLTWAVTGAATVILASTRLLTTPDRDRRPSPWESSI